MSYGKIWKVCQDYALGIAACNIAIGNLTAMKTAWEAEHGSDQPASIGGARFGLGNPYSSFGTHNTPPIPRAVVRVTPTSNAGLAFARSYEAFSGIVTSVTKAATGTWHIGLDQTLALFFADPRPTQSNNTVTRFCVPYGSFVGGSDAGIVIQTYDLQAGDFVLTDYEFSCSIYSYS